MISHDCMTLEPDKPFVFADLLGMTCSICAPASWLAMEVEAFAGKKFRSSGWRSIDKSKMGLGSPTPNPCNVAGAGRLHHFLMRFDHIHSSVRSI